MPGKAYYLRSRILEDRTIVGPAVLVEATKAQVVKGTVAGEWYERVSGTFAHRWVRKGLTHETGLWIDDSGRVRNSR